MFRLFAAVLTSLAAVTSAVGLRAPDFVASRPNPRGVLKTIRGADSPISAAAAAAAARQPSTDFSADFNGNSGGFKLFIQKDANFTRSFWNIMYQSLTELGPDGRPLQNRRIAHIPFQVKTQGGGPCEYTEGMTYDCVWVDLESRVQSPVVGDVSLLIHHAIYYVPALQRLPDNSSLSISANTMKLSFTLSGWQFAPGSSGLQLKIKASSSGEGGEDGPEEGPPGNSSEGYEGDDMVHILPVDDYVATVDSISEPTTMNPEVRTLLRGLSDSVEEVSHADDDAVEPTVAPALAELVYHDDATNTVVMDSGEGVQVRMKFEGTAYVDEEAIQSPVRTDMDGSNIIRLTLPPFRYSIWYDPTITIGETPNSGAGATGAAAFAVVSALLAVAASVAVVL